MKKFVLTFVIVVGLLALAPSLIWSQTAPSLVWKKSTTINTSPVAMAILKNNNYVIVSSSQVVDSTQKISYFSEDGNLIWQNRLNLPKEYTTDLNCVIDMNNQNGFLVIITHLENIPTQNDTLVHFDYEGNVIKKMRIGHRHRSSLAIYKDNDNYYVVETGPLEADIHVYDNDLNFIRLLSVSGRVKRIISRDNYLYIASSRYGGGIITNVSSDISKYDVSGNLISSVHLPDRYSNFIAFDNGGDLYSARVEFTGSVAPAMCWEIMKLDTDLNVVWTRKWLGDYEPLPTSLSLWARDLVALPTGGCVVVGSATKLNQNPVDPNKDDPMAIAFDGQGDILWKLRIDEPDKKGGAFFNVKWDNQNYLLLLGINEDTCKNIWKYRIDGVTSVERENSSLPTDFSLSQNYPNPFNPSTTIEFSVVKEGGVSLRVYDILGREVATLVNEELAVGNYSTKFDADKLTSGIYVYVLKTGNFVSSKKMILLK